MATARRIEGTLRIERRSVEATDATTATLSGVVKRPIEGPPGELINENTVEQTNSAKLQNYGNKTPESIYYSLLASFFFKKKLVHIMA